MFQEQPQAAGELYQKRGLSAQDGRTLRLLAPEKPSMPPTPIPPEQPGSQRTGTQPCPDVWAWAEGSRAESQSQIHLESPC